MEPSTILTAEQLGQRWGLSKKWVLNHARASRDPLPHYKLGRYIRFRDDARLSEWFERRSVANEQRRA